MELQPESCCENYEFCKEKNDWSRISHCQRVYLVSYIAFLVI